MSFAFFAILFSICTIQKTNSMNFDTVDAVNFHSRNILSDGKQNHSAKHNHTETKDAKVLELMAEESMVGTEAAALIIVVIVVLCVIAMVVYFVRKFDQLNRTLPTYRYSSLKTEINGMYGYDDKVESQVLVTVSTEEEDDFDDDDEDNLSPPTLLVKSQTVMPSKLTNGSLPSHENKSDDNKSTMDSDDELLQ